MLPESTFGAKAKPDAPRRVFPFHLAHVHGPLQVDSSRRLARWSLLAGLIVAVWCAVLVMFVLLPQLPARAEKRLPVAQSSPKLNPTSAEAMEPEPIALVQAEDPLPPAIPFRVDVLELPKPPPLPEPPAVEVPLPLPLPMVSSPPTPPVLHPEVAVEEDLTDLVYLIAPARAHSLGDTPMTRTWKLLSASTIFAAMFSTPASAQDAILDRLDKMQKSITDSFKDLRLDVTSLQGDSIYQRTEAGKTNLRVEKLEIQLSKMQADLEAIRKRLETPALYPPSGDRFDEIKKQLTSIEQAIRGGDGITQVAKSSPSVGRVMLVNMYPEDLLFVVNQRNIRVPPGATMPLDNMMSGSLSYEVISPTWGLRARTTTTLNPNETLTLTAR